jgi:hypothetical protein
MARIWGRGLVGSCGGLFGVREREARFPLRQDPDQEVEEISYAALYILERYPALRTTYVLYGKIRLRQLKRKLRC